MLNPLLEVQQELRRRKNKTVRRIFYSEDVGVFTIVPVGDEENNKRSNFNVKPEEDWDAERTVNWIEYKLSDSAPAPADREL